MGRMARLSGGEMTEYHVQELAGTHLKDLTDAEDMAEELAQVSGTAYGVYVLLSEFHPNKKHEPV